MESNSALGFLLCRVERHGILSRFYIIKQISCFQNILAAYERLEIPMLKILAGQGSSKKSIQEKISLYNPGIHLENGFMYGHCGVKMFL